MPERLHSPLSSEEWNRLLEDCDLPLEGGDRARQAAVRNRAILWLPFDTGMQVAELCRLRLWDVDPQQGIVAVAGNGSKTRQLTLSQQGRQALLGYLDQCRKAEASACGEQERRIAEPLFLSETGRPLTEEAVALVLRRLRQRAGISKGGITPSLLRESFVIRYLLAGGDPVRLQEILSVKDGEVITRYQHFLAHLIQAQKRKERQEDHLSSRLLGLGESREP